MIYIKTTNSLLKLLIILTGLSFSVLKASYELSSDEKSIDLLSSREIIQHQVLLSPNVSNHSSDNSYWHESSSNVHTSFWDTSSSSDGEGDSSNHCSSATHFSVQPATAYEGNNENLDPTIEVAPSQSAAAIGRKQLETLPPPPEGAKWAWKTLGRIRSTGRYVLVDIETGKFYKASTDRPLFQQRKRTNSSESPASQRTKSSSEESAESVRSEHSRDSRDSLGPLRGLFKDVTVQVSLPAAAPIQIKSCTPFISRANNLSFECIFADGTKLFPTVRVDAKIAFFTDTHEKFERKKSYLSGSVKEAAFCILNAVQLLLVQPTAIQQIITMTEQLLTHF